MPWVDERPPPVPEERRAATWPAHWRRYAFALAVPSVVLCFHTLWMLLNPFARIYHKKAELRQSWLHNKDHFFSDLLDIGEHKGRVFVTYTDGEQETLSLFGIRNSHRQLLKEHFRAQIAAGKTPRSQ